MYLKHSSGGKVYRCLSRSHTVRFFVVPGDGATAAVRVAYGQLEKCKAPPRTARSRPADLPKGVRPLLDCEKDAVKEAERAAADKDPEAITSHRAATVAKEGVQVAHPALDAVLQLLCEATTSDTVPAWFPGRPVRKCITLKFEFYRKLLDEGRGYKYQNVRRWTKSRRGIDLFDYDVFFAPINHGNTHWALAVVDFGGQRIEYIDSIRSFWSTRQKMALLKKLQRYLGDEWRDKKGDAGAVPAFSLHVRDDAPQQDNTKDCGVFALAFAVAIACGRSLASINQKGIAYYRKRLGAAAQLYVQPEKGAEDSDEDSGGVEYVGVNK